MQVTALARIQTSLGQMLAAASPNGVCLLEFLEVDTAETRIRQLAPCLESTPADNGFPGMLRHELESYFSGNLKIFQTPLDLQGTAFQLSVWNQLQKIPYGQTRSYADIALAIGNPGAVRAVGSANRSNPVGILVPCHRVIQKNGMIGGYDGGVDRKRYLLNLERDVSLGVKKSLSGYRIDIH